MEHICMPVEILFLFPLLHKNILVFLNIVLQSYEKRETKIAPHPNIACIMPSHVSPDISYYGISFIILVCVMFISIKRNIRKNPMRKGKQRSRHIPILHVSCHCMYHQIYLVMIYHSTF